MTTATKLWPILFQSAMVRAILEGRKSQTRRIVKLPKSIDAEHYGEAIWEQAKPPSYPHDGAVFVDMAHPIESYPWIVRCPYGQPGDVLWVREAVNPGREGFMYRADCTDDAAKSFRWKPSIHMPYAACRLWLEVVSVKVERIQSISAADIIAEGAVDRPHDASNLGLGKCPVSAFDGCVYSDLRNLWWSGWNGINGKGSFESDPWCRRIAFKRTEKP